MIYERPSSRSQQPSWEHTIMELQQLRYFHDIAKTQNMTLSAKRLNVAQPALSQSMKKLENELGVKLFEHTGRNIRLSANGEFLDKQLAPALSIIGDIPERVRSFSLGEPCAINVGMYSASKLVIDSIARYKANHRKARFCISQSPDETRHDIVVRTVRTQEASATPSRASTCIFRERIGIALPTSIAKRNVVNLSELEDEQFVLLAGSKGFRSVCDELCASKGFFMRNAIESDNPDAVRKLIGLGLGVGFWPEYSWGTLEESNARFAPIDDKDFVRSIIVKLDQKEGAPSEAKEFFEFLVNDMGTMFKGQATDSSCTQ